MTGRIAPRHAPAAALALALALTAGIAPARLVAQVHGGGFVGLGSAAGTLNAVAGARLGVALVDAYRIELTGARWIPMAFCSAAPGGFGGDEGWACDDARSLHLSAQRIFGRRTDIFRPRAGLGVGVREWSWEPRRATSALISAGGTFHTGGWLHIDVDIQHHVQSMYDGYDPGTVLIMGLTLRP